MSLNYGFYNSLNHDRVYDANDFSSIFNGIINDGVFMNIGTAFTVKADTGLNINVGIGRAWFDGTWTYNDAILPLVAPASDLLYDRIDAVVLEINKTGRSNNIKFVKGTAATNPVDPVMTKTTYIIQYPLCYILRKANSTEITQSAITNKVGSSDTPFVTGILQTISLDTLLGQWETELNEFVKREETDMGAWFENKKIEYDNWVAASQDDYDTWITRNEKAFTDWFQQMQDTLNENVVANLQTQINTATEQIYNFVNCRISFNSDGVITQVYPDQDLKITTEFPSGTVVRKRYKNSDNTLVSTETTSFEDNGDISKVITK